ncbi:AraC-like ligand-binding domain-containing protein [Haloactinomyces albus]|uniref:AraC-like ligand-binding domain-containing protein n=1 Tax=Haloactinomyces albus TaxID=1352928 RepID=UPI0040432938
MDSGQRSHATDITTSATTDFSTFRNAVSTSFVPLEVTSDNAEEFRGRLRCRDVDGLHISDVIATPHVVERTPDLISRADRHYYKISVQLSGTGLLVQDNREALLRPGDLAIYDTHRPYSLVFGEDFRTLVIMFGKNLIDIPSEMISQLTAVRMPGTDGIGSMITPFLARLVDNLEELDGSTGTRIAHSTLDLVTTLYARELDLEHTATHPHHALMRKIRSYIDANLAAPDLGPARIAAAHYISTRHLHGVFKEHGATVAGWIRQRRLHRCKRELCDPVHAGRSIAAIAARWGFSDAAHFSRVFKAEFGQSPSEARLRASAP